jgi:hypothetical protein
MCVLGKYLRRRPSYYRHFLQELKGTVMTNEFWQVLCAGSRDPHLNRGEMFSDDTVGSRHMSLL